VVLIIIMVMVMVVVSAMKASQQILQFAVFCVSKACSLVGEYQHCEEHIASIFRVQNEGSMSFSNVGTHLPDYTVSQPM
jgi:hypothetical protein